MFSKAMQKNVDQIIRGNLTVNSYQIMVDQIVNEYFAENLYNSLKHQNTIDHIVNSNL